MKLVVEGMVPNVGAQVGSVALQLDVAQGDVASYRDPGHPTHRTAVSEAVLDGLHLHVVPVGPESGEDSAMVGHVPIAVRRPLPHANGGEMLGLSGSDVPLVDGVVRDPVEPNLPGAPGLHAGPLNACQEVLGLPR